MARKRHNKVRDCRFDDWRRNSVSKGGAFITLPLYSTDLDGIEYVITKGVVVPIAMIEKKNNKSKWLEQLNDRTPLKSAVYVANAAGIPFYVCVHNEECSQWSIYNIEVHGKDLALIAVSIRENISLFEYVAFLCELRNYELPDNFKQFLSTVVAITVDGESVEV